MRARCAKPWADNTLDEDTPLQFRSTQVVYFAIQHLCIDFDPNGCFLIRPCPGSPGIFLPRIRSTWPSIPLCYHSIKAHFHIEPMRSASMQSPSTDAASNIVFLGLAWVMSYTAMPAEPTAILAALIVIDFFAGIGKSLACGIAITSHRMRIGILSKLGLLLIPLVIALAAKGLSKDLVWIVGYTINLMILSELYSILANIYTVRTGRDAPEWDVVSVLLSKIRQIMDRIDGGRH